VNRHVRFILMTLIAGTVINAAVAWIVPNAFGAKHEVTRTDPSTGATATRWVTSRNRHGWPMIALVDEMPRAGGSWITSIGLGTRIELALGPVWPGLLINAVFYAAILWLIASGRHAARRFLRFHRGRCIYCDYDLRGSRHAQCPECGGGVGAVVTSRDEHTRLPLRAFMLIVNGAMFIIAPVAVMISLLPSARVFDVTESWAHLLYVCAILPFSILSFLAIGVSVDPNRAERKGLCRLATCGTVVFMVLAFAIYDAEASGRALGLLIVTAGYGLANLAALHVPGASRGGTARLRAGG